MPMSVGLQISQLTGAVNGLMQNGAPMSDWACPVPWLGDLRAARMATASVLPSRQEFVDRRGMELCGPDRRLPTLTSLGLRSWGEAHRGHHDIVLEACRTYFRGKPRRRWFAALERLLLAGGTSLFDPLPAGACHVHLLPYALTRAWGRLRVRERATLHQAAARHVAHALGCTSAHTVILGGRSAVDLFQQLAGTSLEKCRREDWDLEGRSGVYARGESFCGSIDSLSGVSLGRRLLVLGVNYNLHTSFGLNQQVLDSMAEWVEARIRASRLSP